MKPRFIVITKAEECDGNLACDVLRIEATGKYVAVQVPIFRIGEIIVADENGREIGGAQRMADKCIDGHAVDAEEFRSVRKAIKLARHVMKTRGKNGAR